MAALEYNEEDIDSRRGNERLIHWMMAEGFLHDSMRCGRDLTQMRLERDPNISKDHFCWRCPRANCRARISVRDGSFFARSHLSNRKQLKVLINFVAESSARSTALRLRINRKHVGKIYKHARRLYSTNLVTAPITFQDGFEYEADELYLRHVRVEPGVFRKQWVAGILERATGKLVYYRVENRSSESLLPPITQRLPFGVFVYTDDWPAYRPLDEMMFLHYSVNHSAGEYARHEMVEGVPINVHINTIEGYNTWVRAKLRNRPRRTIQRLDVTLDEITYRCSGRSSFAPFKI